MNNKITQNPNFKKNLHPDYVCIFIIFLLLLLPLLPSAALSQGIVCGYVTEAESGKPLAGITVALRDKHGIAPALPPPPSAQTDTTGYFELRYVKIGGTYTVDAIRTYEFENGRLKHTLMVFGFKTPDKINIVNFTFSPEEAKQYLDKKRNAFPMKTQSNKRIKADKEYKKFLAELIKRNVPRDSLLHYERRYLSMKYKSKITDKNGEFLPLTSYFEIVE